MKASRRDYDRLAAAIKAARQLVLKKYNPESVLCLLTEDICDILEDNNAAFKRDAFFAACQLDPSLCRGKEDSHART